MNLTRAVIHEIIKVPQSNGANSFLSEELLPITQDTIMLASNLNAAFSREHSSYGNFKKTENLFFDEFQLHQNTKTENSFLIYTKKVTSILSNLLGTIFFAKGGFFVFCEYSLNSTNFIGVYLVRDMEGVLFNKDNDTHTFKINSARYLDTNKLAMGARININKLTDEDNNHITLTKSPQTDISDYFIDWLGITRPESSTDFTNKLFNIITDIQLPINPATGVEYRLNEFRETAYNLIKAAPDKIVNLRNLSSVFYGDENIIISFAEEKGYELDHEFRYDGRALNKFKRIEVNKDGIRLSFSRGDFTAKKVYISEDDAELVMIRSKKLVESIKSQINMQ